MIFDVETNVTAVMNINYFTVESPALFESIDVMCLIKKFLENYNIASN